VKHYTGTMFSLGLVAIALVHVLTVVEAGPLHASCKINWYVPCLCRYA